MKTRINKVVFGNGSTCYYPQVRRMFIWCNFRKYHSFGCSSDLFYSSLAEAKGHLDLQLVYKNAKTILSTVKIEYP